MILKSEAKKAGIEDVSPRDRRRTFITSLFEAGNDIMFRGSSGWTCFAQNIEGQCDNRREREETSQESGAVFTGGAEKLRIT